GAAAAGVAGKSLLARLAGRAFLPLALGLMGWDAWQGDQKDGWKGAILNPLTFGLYSGGAEASEGPSTELPTIDVDQGGGEAVTDAQAIAEQIRAAFTSIDLYGVGQEMKARLA